jgi:NAD(P)-dependent dehydrogenase (short-subunit alcohol dehydrogenase family)
MLGRLSHRVAIVTGGSSGIGRAVALAYAREGAKIVIADKDTQSKGCSETTSTTAEAITRQYGTDAVFTQTDVSSVESVNELVAQTVRKYSRLDM